MATKTVPPPKPRDSSGKPGFTLDGASITRVLAVDAVPDTGLEISLCAGEAERAALAKACGLVAVHDFEADFDVRKQDRAKVKVTGRLRARVTQTCVVSLEPFETLVNADIDVDFAPTGEAFGQAASPAAAVFHAGGDPPDPIIDGKIDLGALGEEFLILNLDVHPRKPGVSFGTTEIHGEPSGLDSPFAVLRRRS